MASRLPRFRCESGALNDRGVKLKQGGLSKMAHRRRRLIVALIFAAPAVVAGYALVHGVTKESVPSEIWRHLLHHRRRIRGRLCRYTIGDASRYGIHEIIGTDAVRPVAGFQGRLRVSLRRCSRNCGFSWMAMPVKSASQMPSAARRTAASLTSPSVA